MEEIREVSREEFTNLAFTNKIVARLISEKVYKFSPQWLARAQICAHDWNVIANITRPLVEGQPIEFVGYQSLCLTCMRIKDEIATTREEMEGFMAKYERPWRDAMRSGEYGRPNIGTD